MASLGITNGALQTAPCGQVAEHHQLLHAHIGRGSEPPRKPPKVPGCLRWILD